MRISDLLEDVDFYQLSQIESFVEALWDRLNVDVKFTRHFLDRLNDPRNGKPISSAELIRLFKKEYERNGKDIAQLGDVEAVMKDLLTNINLPFVMKDTPDGKELVAKTIMRKPNFKTPDPEFVINESKKGKGDCFHVAGRTMLDHPGSDFKLVHAMVTGQGPLEGKRFPHAWNEVGDVVLDYSNGNKIVMRKEQYYRLGHVDTSPGNIAIYDSETAMKKMVRNKHWGPWDLADENS
jgi:hypothetical protein